MNLASLTAYLTGPPHHVHLIGVAGSGMSGIAALLLALGHRVSGSDKVATVDDTEGVVFREYRSAPEGLPRVETPADTGRDALLEAAGVVSALHSSSEPAMVDVKLKF